MTPAPAGATPVGFGPAVFVSSLGHSGSTVLDLLLSSHPRLVSLGEVQQFLRTLGRGPLPEHPCTCGASLDTCPLWGTVVASVQADDSLTERYRATLDRFRQIAGPDAIPVDSSKTVWGLRGLMDAGATVLVVDLVRDVRSWTTADRARRLDDRRVGGRAGRSAALRAQPLVAFLEWHRLNRRRQAAVAASGARSIAMGYEPLVEDPSAQIQRVWRALGIDDSPEVILGRGGGHLPGGNRMRLADHAVTGIQVDRRWQETTRWRHAARLLPHVMAYNQRCVYPV